MRILILGDINSPHLIKWALGLSSRGLIVSIFSLSKYDKNNPLYNSSVEVFSFGLNKQSFDGKALTLRKISYLMSLFSLRDHVKKFNPDIIHAHYASSYGLLGALLNFKTFFISLWGSDVYEFPKKSFIHKLVLKFNLSRASKVFSTSRAMAQEAKLYTPKKIIVVPFGVDLYKFAPKKSSKDKIFNEEVLVIGIIKSLEERYGVNYLLKAFHILKKKRKENLKLFVGGDGSQEQKLKLLSYELGISHDVFFAGKIVSEDVSEYQNLIDIAVFPSNFESFGVSALEASACQKPVVATCVGGLPEVVENGVTGLIVQEKNPQALSDAIEFFIDNPDKAKAFGVNGRFKVQREYSWEYCLNLMLKEYCF
jgi:glycosyltransferase involved in cell wall biosynthesis